MRDRIKLIMEKENLTPAKFADRLQINRTVISHILNGRNKTSLDVVTKIMSEMEHINIKWLLNGTGSMYNEGYNVVSPSGEPDLFNQIAPDTAKIRETVEKTKETGFKQVENRYQIPENRPVNPPVIHDKKISRIIVYFNDNTFEIFENI